MRSRNRPRALLRGALRIACGGLLAFALTLPFALGDRRPILIQSLESRTRQDGPVFNRVAWIPGWRSELWLMQQSHEGLKPPFHQWDRLAIVIDKTQRPARARFYQLEPGRLAWEPGARLKPLRASCFMCHSNGPRAIRPDLASAQVALAPWDRLRLLVWNLRIKTYGRIAGSGQATGPNPFRLAGRFENEPLRVQTCTRCHNESRWGRGFLTRQNFLSIHFMVEHGFMPPPGFRLSDSDRAQVEAFTRGLPAAAGS